MSGTLPLLIVGAGPFGLAMARYARVHGVEHRIVGRPMSFWREHMPPGMLLRSGTSWHLDPEGELTFEPWMRERGLERADVTPLSLERYLDYARWYTDAAGIQVREALVESLERERQGDREVLVARLSDGEMIVARSVYLAVGFRHFAHVPEELDRLVPADRRIHTRDLIDMASCHGLRVLIVGGRQSAFETAALLCEAGARSVHVSHRHPSPDIAESDWSWVDSLLGRMEADPGWYRGLPAAERERIDRRFWEEGRLKVEPWLGPRLDPEVVRLLPETRLSGCEPRADGGLRVRLTSAGDGAAEPTEAAVEVDRIVLATGYRPDLARLPFLAPELLDELALRDGFPALDERFESRVSGLFITSMPATRDFGSFLAFTVSVRSATRVAGRAIAARLRSGSYPSDTPAHEQGASP